MAGRYARLRRLAAFASERPPQMPKRSSFSRAYSRHWDRTSHVVQMRFASRVEPPFSGKKASGSVCAQRESVCQASGFSSSPAVLLTGRRRRREPRDRRTSLLGRTERYSVPWPCHHPLPSSLDVDTAVGRLPRQ